MLENDERIGPYLERPSFLTLRYEDLVCRPEDTMERLHGFLGCDRSTRYLPYDPRDDRYPDRWSWVPEASGPIDPSHAFKWKAQLGSSDLERITGMAGGFIDRHGYDR